MTSQNNRHAKLSHRPPVSFVSDQNQPAENLLNPKESKISPKENVQTSRGTTRHPWAVNVAVKEEEEQSLEENLSTMKTQFNDLDTSWRNIHLGSLCRRVDWFR